MIYDKQREKYFAISGAAQGEQGQNKRFLAQWISPDGKQEESFDLRPEARYYPNAISLSDGKILIICTNIVGPYDHRMESFIFDPDKKTTSTSVSLKSSASLAFPKVAMNENGEGVVTMIGWPSWGERPSSGLYYSKIAKDGTIGEPQLLVRKPFNTAQSAVSTSHFDIVTAVNYGAPSYTYYVINRASGEIRMASITPPTSTNERLAFDAPDICVLPGGMLHLSSSVSKTVPNKPGEDRDVWQANMKPGDLSVWDQHFSTKPDRSELFPRASSSNGSIWTVYSGWSNKAFSDSGIYAEKREISPAPQTHNIYLPFIKK